MDPAYTKITRPAAVIASRLMRRPVPQGRLGVLLLGHRRDIGGKWDEVGKLQFEFMIGRGLQPETVFLDIACGSLRGGVHFIRYLQPGNYLGLDKEKTLIEAGVKRELGESLSRQRRPEFVVSDSFEFERFSKRPKMSLAQSLFTHLTIGDIEQCLRKLNAFAPKGHVLYATFNEGDSSNNPVSSHAHGVFAYRRDELGEVGARTGWEPSYVGDWGHPRGQVMYSFVQA